MVLKGCSIDEVHALLEAGAMITLISDLLQEHPGMDHLMQERLFELQTGAELQLRQGLFM